METLRKTSTAAHGGVAIRIRLLWAILIASPGIADEAPQTVGFRAAMDCGACHSRVYDEWSESWMARSYSNATFQAIYAYRTEYDKQNATTTARSCLRCHAPLVFLYQDETGKREKTAEGVSCDFCHRVAEVNERSSLEGRVGIRASHPRLAPFIKHARMTCAAICGCSKSHLVTFFAVLLAVFTGNARGHEEHCQQQ